MAEKTVIKLNNIPHGFYEEQMKDYFSQFGKVKHVLLMRSKKTHKSRGYGFVEFAVAQVARAAAEAMHNYLFFNNVLKCRQMNRNDLPKEFFRMKFTGPNNVVKQKIAQNKKTVSAKKIEKYKTSLSKIQEILATMGIKYACHIINEPDDQVPQKKIKRKTIKIQ